MSLQMTYEHNGTVYEGDMLGGNGGESTKISLKDSESYLVQVKGTFGKCNGVIAITSLTFISSKATFGPFGTPRGQPFQTYRNGKVVGFFGKAGAFIDQLGVMSKLRAGKISDVASHVGPWDGNEGKAFHDGQGHICEINVRHSSSQIVALQAAYVQGDCVHMASKHGDSSEGNNIVKISFTGADEYLTQIKGTFAKSQVSGIVIITSLLIISNKKTYGPFGLATGTAFETPTGKRIVGLFGRAATYVDQIGVVVTAVE